MHKFSLPPQTIIGYLPSGRPVRFQAGGAEDGEGTDTNPTGTGVGDSGQQDNSTGQNDGTGTGGQADDTTPSGSTGQEPDDSAARTIAAVRSDFKAERTKRQGLEKDLAAVKKALTDLTTANEQRTKALAKALGLDTDEAPDPDKLARELESLRKDTTDQITLSSQRLQAVTVELELYRQASQHGANAGVLADSRSFMRKLDGLDPAADSFADDLGELVKTAVKDNPAYKLTTTTTTSSGTSNAAGQGSSGDNSKGQTQQQNGAKTTAPPARSGSDGGHNGAAGGNRQWTDEDVDRADPKDVKAAQEAGLLVDLGFGPGKTKRV